MSDDEAAIEKVMATTGIDRAGAEQALVDGKRLAESIKSAVGISCPVTLAGRAIVLDVLGTPAPKGSARAMLIGGRARLITGSSNGNMTAQSRWARAVRDVALAQPDRYVGGVPLHVVIEFRVARPAAAKRRMAPTVKPDLDKLARCTLDALVTTKQRGKVLAGIIDDDARIVRLEVEKCYAEPGNEGARIVIGPWCAR